jgi:hypothetical protein
VVVVVVLVMAVALVVWHGMVADIVVLELAQVVDDV